MKLNVRKSTQGPVLAKGSAGDLGSNCSTYGVNTSDTTTVGGNSNGIGVGTQINSSTCVSGGYNPVNGSGGASVSCTC